MSEYKCDPCLCPEMYYRDKYSFRKALIILLCSIRALLTPQGGDADGEFFPG